MENAEGVEVPVPYIGLTLHYLITDHSKGLLRVPATVNSVAEPGNPESPLGLTIFLRDRMDFKENVPYGEQPNSWVWPNVTPTVTLPQ